MQIKYKLEKEDHFVTFCKTNSLEKISKFFEKINSDKNVLLLYDKNINKEIIKKIYNELKISGCNIILKECKGDKINKNKKFLFDLIDTLLKNKFTKRSVVFSCGGGVIGDVSALASSLYLRGLYYFNIPTTITSIIDNSIGGKTAINYRGITNSIGTYYHPKNVFILEEVLKTLPEREFISGIAEIIKCGLIDNIKIIKFLIKNKEEIIERKFNYLNKLCAMTIKTKIKYFKDDIYEKNKRLYLNFGHTFAHAIEMAIENVSKKDVIRHGEAVSLGMLCEIYYANNGKSNFYNETKNLLGDFKLPTKIFPKKININQIKLQNDIYKNIFMDKKKIDKYPRYISLKKIGHPKIVKIENFNFLNDTILQLFT